MIEHNFAIERNSKLIFSEIKTSKNLTSLVLNNERKEKSFKTHMNQMKKVNENYFFSNREKNSKSLEKPKNKRNDLNQSFYLFSNLNINEKKNFNIKNSEFSIYFDQSNLINNINQNFYSKKNELRIIKRMITESFVKNIKVNVYNRLLENNNCKIRNYSTVLNKVYKRKEESKDSKFSTKFKNSILHLDTFKFPKEIQNSKISKINSISSAKYLNTNKEEDLNNLKPIRIKKFIRENESPILKRLRASNKKESHFFTDVSKYISDSKAISKNKNIFPDTKTDLNLAVKMTSQLIDKYRFKKYSLGNNLNNPNKTEKSNEKFSTICQDIEKKIFTPNDIYNLRRISNNHISDVVNRNKSEGLINLVKKTNSKFYLNLERNKMNLKIGKLNH